MEIKEVKFLTSVVEFKKEISPMSNEHEKNKIFFLWRSNVGKSSMINSLLWEKNLAFAADKPGKTRTINIFVVNKKYHCMDFPGYWYAIWGKENKLKLRDMVLNYLENNSHKNLKAVIILDAVAWPTPLDLEIYDYLIEKNVNILLVLNKVDKTNQKELELTKSKVRATFPWIKFELYSCKNERYKKWLLTEIFS